MQQGQFVSVDVTGIPVFNGYFEHCHLDATIANVVREKNQIIAYQVYFLHHIMNKNTKVYVLPWQVQPARGSDLRKNWKEGDLIQVHLEGDCEGWWDAIFVDHHGGGAFVEWIGDYDNHDDISHVNYSQIRSA